MSTWTFTRLFLWGVNCSIYDPGGKLTKVQKDCFRDAWRPSLIPPSPSGKGSIYFPRKKFTSQPFLDSTEFFRGIISRIKKTKRPPPKNLISHQLGQVSHSSFSAMVLFSLLSSPVFVLLLQSESVSVPAEI